MKLRYLIVSCVCVLLEFITLFVDAVVVVMVVVVLLSAMVNHLFAIGAQHGWANGNECHEIKQSTGRLPKLYPMDTN